MIQPKACPHTTASYDAEKDNYYCDVCNMGMGQRYYAESFGQDAVRRQHAETGAVKFSTEPLQMADGWPERFASLSAAYTLDRTALIAISQETDVAQARRIALAALEILPSYNPVEPEDVQGYQIRKVA